MAAVTREVVIDVPIEEFFAVVIDYPSYPEFVPGIRACKVKKDGPEKHVEYELDLGIKRVKYVRTGSPGRSSRAT
jgi:ribosome-associated toxin RatA of RatAB toxin-antitoxin module